MQLKLLSHLFHSLTILWEELFFLKADDNLGIYKVSPPGGGPRDDMPAADGSSIQKSWRVRRSLVAGGG